MRSVWTGNLAFGLVSIPVKLGTAVSSHKISFRQVHLADQGRVRYQKTCELDEEVLTAADIARAYETPDEQLVEVTDDDLKTLPLPTAKTIEVSGFLDAASIDSMQLDTPYYLAPASAAANKPYILMREALARADKAAVGKFAMRNSEHLALIRARDDVLMLQTLRWPDELNSPADAAPKGKVSISDSELQLADTLISALGEADLSTYQDEYAQAVEALVTAKMEGVEPPAAGEGGSAQVVDLMAALRASVEQAQGDRPAGSPAKDATVTELKPKGKTAAKKAAAKPAAKKTAGPKESAAAARKSTAKKTSSGSASRSASRSATKAASKTASKSASTSKSAAKKTAAKRRAG